MSQPKQVQVVSVDARRAGQGMEPTAFFDEDGQPIEFGGGGAVAWGDVTGKPSTFPPGTHTHTIANVTGLQAKIDELEGRLDELEA